MTVQIPTPSLPKSQSELAAEWDQLSESRDRDISSGRDPSYWHVILPSIMQHHQEWLGKRVLDVGCGSGHLTVQLAEKASSVVGIDLSSKAIELAKARFPNRQEMFFATSLDELIASDTLKPFDVVVLNMVIQTIYELDQFLVSARKVAIPHGCRIIATLPHPCFWPRYWGFDQADWYSYNSITTVEAPFRTSLNQSRNDVVTYIHRPLGDYFRAFSSLGLSLASFNELAPSPDSEPLFPTRYNYPRFVKMMWMG